MTLEQQQKDLLIGTLLGDGNLQTATQGRTWRYRALHQAEHKEYLQHKYQILQNFCTSPPVYAEIGAVASEVLDPVSIPLQQKELQTPRKVIKRWYFNTTVHESFRYYGNLFYTYNPMTGFMLKDVPLTIEKLLTPCAIAYWYMDDGSIKWLGKSNAMRICTESFSEEGVHRLRQALKNLYNIEVQLTRKTNNRVFVGYRLAINEANSAPFRELIRPYLIDCMRYKVSDGNKGHL